jgi:hypothetical protein
VFSEIYLEFQTTNKSDDIKRFMAYDALPAYKENKIVKTVVVYSSNVKSAATTLDLGSTNYNFNACYMCDVNGDKLTKQDMISFGFLPLMKSKKDKNELAIEAVKQ